MKTLIVYDSVFGNTEKVAQAMAAALGAQALRVGSLTAAHLQGVDLLIVGSPTRGFRPTEAIAAWLKALPAGSLQGVRAAAFDTGMRGEDIKPRIMSFIVRFGYAAKPIAEGLKKAGASLATEPLSFWVADREGPMKDGEIERAAQWAKKIERE